MKGWPLSFLDSREGENSLGSIDTKLGRISRGSVRSPLSILLLSEKKLKAFEMIGIAEVSYEPIVTSCTLSSMAMS